MPKLHIGKQVAVSGNQCSVSKITSYYSGLLCGVSVYKLTSNDFLESYTVTRWQDGELGPVKPEGRNKWTT